MLPTIREFALERLETSGEAARTRARHAGYFGSLAASANLREDKDGEQHHDLVIRDADNIRAALHWALDHDRAQFGLELAVALESFWWTSAAPEGRRWFESFLRCPQEIPLGLHARALRAYGTTTVFAGDIPGAETLHERSLQIYRGLGDEPGTGGVLHCLAACAGDCGDIARARRLIEESLEILRRVGSKSELSAALKILGKVECDAANYQTGIELLECAAAMAAEAGSTFEQGYCLGELCERAFEVGRDDDVETWGRQSLALCQKVGDRQTPLFVLTLLARVALAAGRARHAGRILGAIETEERRAPPGWWTLTPEDGRYNREHYIAPLLEECGAECERGREEGRRLSLDDVISSC